MRPTPTIDPDLQNYRHPSYLNIYELCPDETRLFGTESLFGDWDARVLLLAQDFASKGEIVERASTCPRPYHHRHWEARGRQPPGAKTNKTLFALAATLPGAKLYGSAVGGLLKDSPGMGDRLPDYQRIVEEYAVPMLHFVAREAPRLAAVACVGEKAWIAAAAAFERRDVAKASAFTQLRREGKTINGELNGRRITLHPLYHPARKSVRRLEPEWRPLRDRLSEITGNGEPPHMNPAPEVCGACTVDPG